MQLIGNLSRTFVTVPQLHFNARDKGTVNPFFGRGAAGLTDNRAEITLGETQALSIVTELVLRGAFLVHKQDETVKDCLLAGAGTGLRVGLAKEQAVIVVHQRPHQGRHRRLVAMGLMDNMPQRVQDVECRLHLCGIGLNLKITNLTIEGR